MSASLRNFFIVSRILTFTSLSTIVDLAFFHVCDYDYRIILDAFQEMILQKLWAFADCHLSVPTIVTFLLFFEIL